MSYHPGDCVLLDDGEPGVILAAADDGALTIRTESSILISSVLENMDEAPPLPGNFASLTGWWQHL